MAAEGAAAASGPETAPPPGFVRVTQDGDAFDANGNPIRPDGQGVRLPARNDDNATRLLDIISAMQTEMA
eukprot:10653555-Lingulodinium_polyedra.AAC.1